MIIPVGSLVLVKTFTDAADAVCVVISEGRPEFIGALDGSYYYEVYCFETRATFLCFNYEMILLPTEEYNIRF